MQDGKIETLMREIKAAGGEITGSVLEPGRKVLLVVTMPRDFTGAEMDQLCQAMADVADGLIRDGVQAHGVILPPGASLRCFEVDGDRHEERLTALERAQAHREEIDRRKREA